MTTTACAEAWREIAEKASREAREWRENFATLQRALVGETGASGIEVAHALRKDAERWRYASTSRNFGISFFSKYGQGMCYDEMAAARVDAAMAAEKAAGAA